MLSTRFWKTYFKYYDKLNEIRPYRSLVSDLVDGLGVDMGNLVLDAGAGTGNVSIEIVRRGGNVVALDFSKEGLEILKSKNSGVQLVLADLNQPLPFKDGTFDSLCTNNVLYTLPSGNRPRILSEFFRLLKPGGVIVVSNIKKGFRPATIYLDHLRKEIQSEGVIATIAMVFKFIWPTIMIFYCNWLIKRENKSGDYDFLVSGEQKKLLIDAGFVEVSGDKEVYAGQAIMNKAIKPL